MELGIIERIGDRYEVSEDYRLYWRNLVVGLGEVEEYFLRRYVYWYYCSVYVYGDITLRGEVIYRDIFSREMSREGYSNLLGVVGNLVDRILEEVGNQEERVYRRLVERIDRVVRDYSGSDIDVESEPKKVKAILDMVKLRKELGLVLGLGGVSGSKRRRGNMEEGLIDRLI